MKKISGILIFLLRAVSVSRGGWSEGQTPVKTESDSVAESISSNGVSGSESGIPSGAETEEQYGEVRLLRLDPPADEPDARATYAIAVGDGLLYGFEQGVSGLQQEQNGYLTVSGRDNFSLLTADGEEVLAFTEYRSIDCLHEWILAEKRESGFLLYRVQNGELRTVLERTDDELRFAGSDRETVQLVGNEILVLDRKDGSLKACYPALDRDEWNAAREKTKAAVCDFYQTIRGCSGVDDPKLLRFLPDGAREKLRDHVFSDGDSPKTLKGYALLAFLVEHRAELSESGGCNDDDWEEIYACTLPQTLSGAFLYYSFTEGDEFETFFTLSARTDGTFVLTYFGGDLLTD